MSSPPGPAPPSLTTQTLWLVTAKVLGYALTFAVPLVLVRVLNLVEFGLYKQAFLVISTAQAVLPLGVGLSAFYFLAREPERQPAVVLNILVFHVASGAAAWLLLTTSPGILTALLGNAALAPHADLIGLVILVWVVSSFLETVATAHQDVRLSTVFIVAAQLTKGLAMGGAVIWFPSIDGLLYAALLQGVVQAFALFWYLRSRFGAFWSQFDWSLMRTQLAYAMPFGLAGLIYRLQTDVHQYVVAHAFGPAAFAIYVVGCFQLPLTVLLRDSIGAVMVSRVTILRQHGERGEIVALMVRVMRKLSLLYFPLFTLLLVTGREFIVTLFTPRFVESWPIFFVNLALLPLAVLINDPVLRAYPEHRNFLLKLRVALLAVLVVALQIGIAQLGMLGAIVVVVGILTAERAIITLRVMSILRIRAIELRPLKDLIGIAAAAAVAAIVAAGARTVVMDQGALAVLLICAPMHLLAYVAGLLLLKVPNAEEMDVAHRHWARVRRRLSFGAQPSRTTVS